MLKKINVEKIIYFLIIIVMILVPILKLSTYIPAIEEFYINYFELKRVYVLWASIIFLLITYLYLIFSKNEKIDCVDIIVYILIILAFVSTNYAINFEKSFFGEMYRNEGLLTILSYYFLLLNAKSIKNEKYKNNIVKLFIILGIFQSVYAILQSYTDISFIGRYFVGYMAMGLCSNPNFFGSYMVMEVLIIGYMYIYNPKRRYLCIYTLFGLALYLAESTGPVLSVLITLIFSMFILPKKLKKIFKLIIILLMTFVFADLSLKYVQNNKFETELIEGYDISADISTILETPLEEVGSGRLTIWNNSLPLVKKYWLVGCGLDNFKNAYPNIGDLKYDKAHNVYLQISITNGLPALILFLVLLFIVFIKGIKLKNNFITPIYMAFIGYSIQAFFNISVIDVAPYYYIIIGLILSEKDKNISIIKEKINLKKLMKRLRIS